MNKVKKILSANASWVVLVALVVFFSMLSPNFLTTKNFITVLKQVSVNGICAVLHLTAAVLLEICTPFPRALMGFARGFPIFCFHLLL